jgi:hypothetical protein
VALVFFLESLGEVLMGGWRRIFSKFLQVGSKASAGYVAATGSPATWRVGVWSEKAF